MYIQCIHNIVIVKATAYREASRRILYELCKPGPVDSCDEKRSLVEHVRGKLARTIGQSRLKDIRRIYVSNMRTLYLSQSGRLFCSLLFAFECIYFIALERPGLNNRMIGKEASKHFENIVEILHCNEEILAKCFKSF